MVEPVPGFIANRSGYVFDMEDIFDRDSQARQFMIFAGSMSKPGWDGYGQCVVPVYTERTESDICSLSAIMTTM